MSLFKMKSIQTLTPHNAWKMQNIPGKSCLLQDKINNSVIFAIAISSNKILNIRIFSIGGFHVMSLPPCWWMVNKRSLISSLCLSTSICSFHHCYLCLPTLHENHLQLQELCSFQAFCYTIKYTLIINNIMMTLLSGVKD